MATVPKAPFTSIQQLARSLTDSLDAIRPDASFAVSGGDDAFEHLGYPRGFKLEGTGWFEGLLDEEDVKLLISKSYMALDRDSMPIRNGSYEISADVVTFCRLAWKQQQTLVHNVCTQLGVDPTHVRTQFCGIAIHREDHEPHYRPQARHYTGDRTKIFGALSVVVPCEHTGGDVVVTHQNQTRRLKSASRWATDYSYFAYLTGGMPSRELFNHGNQHSQFILDFAFKSDTVSSGTRVTLEYNLIYEGRGPAPAPGDSTKSISSLRSTLERWKLADEEAVVPCMMYALEHPLPDDSLMPDHLSGDDRARMSALSDVGEQLGFLRYLVTIELHRESRVHRRNQQVLRERLVISKIYDARVVCLDITLDPGNVAQASWWTKRHGEPTAPTLREATSAQRYCTTAILILKKESRIEFLSLSENLADTIRSETAVLRERPNDEQRKADLKQLCSTVIEQNEKAFREAESRHREFCNPPYSDDDVGAAAIAYLTMQELALFKSTLAAVRCWLPPDVLYEAGKLAARVYDPALPASLAAALPQYVHLRDRIKAVQNMLLGCIEAADNKEPTWQCSRLAEITLLDILKHDVVLGPDMATACVHVTSLLGCTATMLTVISRLASVAQNNAGFAVSCAQNLRYQVTAETVTQEIFTKYMRCMLPHLVLTPKFKEKPEVFSSPLSTKDAKGLCSPTELRTLYTLLTDLRTSDLLEVFLMDLVNFTALLGHMHMEWLHSHLFPLMAHALDTVKLRWAHPESRYGHEALLDMLLLSYAYGYIGREPTEPKDWTRPPMGCPQDKSDKDPDCESCVDLDNFLAAANDRAHAFAVPEAKRKHLAAQLGVRCESKADDETTLFITHIDKTRRPYALVVEKTTREHDAKKHEWQLRVQRATREISKLREHFHSQPGMDELVQLVFDCKFYEFWKVKENISAQPADDQGDGGQESRPVDRQSSAVLKETSLNAQLAGKEDLQQKRTDGKRKAGGKENVPRKKRKARA